MPARQAVIIILGRQHRAQGSFHLALVGLEQVFETRELARVARRRADLHPAQAVASVV